MSCDQKENRPARIYIYLCLIHFAFELNQMKFLVKCLTQENIK